MIKICWKHLHEELAPDNAIPGIYLLWLILIMSLRQWQVLNLWLWVSTFISTHRSQGSLSSEQLFFFFFQIYFLLHFQVAAIALCLHHFSNPIPVEVVIVQSLSCPTLCHFTDCSMLVSSVLYCLPEFAFIFSSALKPTFLVLLLNFRHTSFLLTFANFSSCTTLIKITYCGNNYYYSYVCIE